MSTSPKITGTPSITISTTPPVPTPATQPKVGTQIVGGKQVKQTNAPPTSGRDTTKLKLRRDAQKLTTDAEKLQRYASKLGISTRAAELISKEVGLSQLKPVTDNEKEKVDALVTKLKANKADYPTKSDSALFLREKLIAMVTDGTPRHKEIIADHMLATVGLKPGEEVSDKHIAKAIGNLARFESSRGTELYNAFRPHMYAGLLRGVITATEKAGMEHVDSIAKLNDNQLCALHCYTVQGHCDAINGPLRGDKSTMEPKYQKAMEIALDAMKLLPPYVGPTYRGCKLPQAIDATVHTGGAFQDKAFISSAASLESAFKGTHQFGIISQTGRDISFVSALSDEKEILFPPDTQFRVVDRTGAVPFGPDGNPTQSGNTVAEGWGACKVVLKEMA